MACCGSCESWAPKTCSPCCEKEICAKYCDKKTGKRGVMVLRIPAMKNVYLVVRYTLSLPLAPQTSTIIPYNLVVKASTGSCCASVWNGTSACIPQCGDGIYTLSAHTSLTAGDADSVFTISINAGGAPIASDTTTVAAGQSVDRDLTISYPLICGQSVTVTVTSSTGGTVAPGSTFFSMVRVSDC